jgi:hypothetical protein
MVVVRGREGLVGERRGGGGGMDEEWERRRGGEAEVEWTKCGRDGGEGREEGGRPPCLDLSGRISDREAGRGRMEEGVGHTKGLVCQLSLQGGGDALIE